MMRRLRQWFVTGNILLITACAPLTEQEKEQRIYERAERVQVIREEMARCKAAGWVVMSRGRTQDVSNNAEWQCVHPNHVYEVLRQF